MKKTTKLILSVVIVLSVFLYAGCGYPLLGVYEYKPQPGTQKWVTITGEDFDPNNIDTARLFPEGEELRIAAQAVSPDGTPYLIVRGPYYGIDYCIKWDDGQWKHLDGITYNKEKLENTDKEELKNDPKALYLYSYDIQMKLDLLDRPHIVSMESYGNEEIYYIYWDGNNWKTADGDIIKDLNYPGVRQEIEITDCSSVYFDLDSSNYPHIAWQSYDRKRDYYSKFTFINYARWDGTNWVNDEDEIFQSSSKNTRIVEVDMRKDIELTNKSILVDSDDNPHLFWNYSVKDNTQFSSEYCFSVNYGGYVKKVDGRWVTADGSVFEVRKNYARIDYPMCLFIEFNSYALDKDNNTYFVWTNFTEYNEDTENRGFVNIGLIKNMNNRWYNVYDFSWNKEKKNHEINLSFLQGGIITQLYPQIVVDNKGDIHVIQVTHFVPSPSRIYYSKWDGDTWKTIDGQTIDSNPKIGSGLALCLKTNSEDLKDIRLFTDKHGKPHIFYRVTAPLEADPYIKNTFYYITSGEVSP